jgi:hypothetical protein
MGDSKLFGDALNKEKRNSQNTWIPTTHWVAGFLWHYVQRANRENFLYDLRNIDGESLQYTRYEAGQFYGWHNDASAEDPNNSTVNTDFTSNGFKLRATTGAMNASGGTYIYAAWAETPTQNLYGAQSNAR